MQNITSKASSYRVATAQAVVHVGSELTISAIREKTVPKGDVLEVSRTAGLFAVKRTSDMIPDCHPLPVEFCEIRFMLDSQTVTIEVEVATVYKTGLEVEAMHGASVVALTIYDMLKPIDKQVEIRTIRLLQKSGGKQSLMTHDRTGAKLETLCGVLVVSDSVYAGKVRDESGQILKDELGRYTNVPVAIEVVPDEKEAITDAVRSFITKGTSLLFTTGGTGASNRDVTPDAILPLLEVNLIGVSEALRNSGQQRTPYAMLSRGVAGFIGETFIATLPGSPSGVRDGISVLLPHVFHLLKVRNGERHN